MSVSFKIHEDSLLSETEIMKALSNFNTQGKLIGTGYRNVIKIIEINNEKYNIKAFKVPNLINRIVYRFFRKSKAERSFLYAQQLLKNDILTPQPEAFIEYKSWFTFGKSFYISKQLEYDFTIRKLVDDPFYEDYENLLKKFTQFTFQLHEKGILFLDHSPGNTLIIKQGNNYDFYLVDLNRMVFKNVSLEERYKNFARLSPKDSMLDIIAKEYSSLINKPEQLVRERMFHYSKKFSSSFTKREKFKRKYFFWRKKKRK